MYLVRVAFCVGLKFLVQNFVKLYKLSSFNSWSTSVLLTTKTKVCKIQRQAAKQVTYLDCSKSLGFLSFQKLEAMVEMPNITHLSNQRGEIVIFIYQSSKLIFFLLNMCQGKLISQVDNRCSLFLFTYLVIEFGGEHMIQYTDDRL